MSHVGNEAVHMDPEIAAVDRRRADRSSNSHDCVTSMHTCSKMTQQPVSSQQQFILHNELQPFFYIGIMKREKRKACIISNSHRQTQRSHQRLQPHCAGVTQDKDKRGNTATVHTVVRVCSTAEVPQGWRRHDMTHNNPHFNMLPCGINATNY